MSEFINTIDLLGDDVVGGAIVDGSITEIKDDILTTIRGYALRECSSLTTIDFPNVTSINSGSFYGCSNLKTVILRSNVLCTLNNTNSFTNTPIASGTGYVYVPRNLVDTYKTDSTWKTYANQFRALEDYPEICGGDN